MASQFQHLSDCSSVRIETFQRRLPDGRHSVTVRCMDCGAQVVTAEPERPLTPAEVADLWDRDPVRLARRLSPAERLDPVKNPLHPMALHFSGTSS